MEFILASGAFRLLAIIIGYALGNIQTSYLFGKYFKNTDIREHGSGNAGTTNTIRIFGFSVGVVVFIVDALKAVVAFLLCMYLFGGSYFGGLNGILPGMYAGVGVVLGHNFPVFMGFKGGKGIASSIGVMLCTNWRIIIIQAALALICVATTRMISVLSLAITLTFPILLYIFGYDIETVLISVFMGVLAWFMHRGNIQRILAGNERKISFGKR